LQKVALKGEIFSAFLEFIWFNAREWQDLHYGRIAPILVSSVESRATTITDASYLTYFCCSTSL